MPLTADLLPSIRTVHSRHRLHPDTFRDSRPNRVDAIDIMLSRQIGVSYYTLYTVGRRAAKTALRLMRMKSWKLSRCEQIRSPSRPSRAVCALHSISERALTLRLPGTTARQPSESESCHVIALCVADADINELVKMHCTVNG